MHKFISCEILRYLLLLPSYWHHCCGCALMQIHDSESLAIYKFLVCSYFQWVFPFSIQMMSFQSNCNSNKFLIFITHKHYLYNTVSTKQKKKKTNFFKQILLIHTDIILISVKWTWLFKSLAWNFFELKL